MFDVAKDERHYLSERDLDSNEHVITKTFESYNDLLYYIKKQYNFGYNYYRPGVTDLVRFNSILNNYAHNMNDFFNRWQWDTSSEDYHKYFQYCERAPKKYTCWDADYRILNLADLARDSFDLDDSYRPPNSKGSWVWKYRHHLWELKWEFRKTRLRNPEVTWCYRRIRTTQERRWACSDEHKPFVRGKRSVHNIPNSWDDVNYARRGYGWKAYSKKKKQWM